MVVPPPVSPPSSVPITSEENLIRSVAVVRRVSSLAKGHEADDDGQLSGQSS